MPLTISWSALRLHEECKAKRYLVFTGKAPKNKDIRNYFHGTVVDRVALWWLRQPEQLPGEMVQAVEDIFNHEELEAIRTGDGQVKWRHSKDRELLINFCKELVVKLEPILYELVVPYDYHPARRFRVPIRIPYIDGNPTTIFLAGETDYITRDQHGVFRGYDLKGTANNSYYRKVIGQGIFYDLSMRAEFGEGFDSFSFIQPMCDQQVVKIDISDDDRAALMQRIIAMAHDIWKHDNTPKPDNAGCSYCEVKHACPKFTPVHPGRMSIEPRAVEQA